MQCNLIVHVACPAKDQVRTDLVNFHARDDHADDYKRTQIVVAKGVDCRQHALLSTQRRRRIMICRSAHSEHDPDNSMWWTVPSRDAVVTTITV